MTLEGPVILVACLLTLVSRVAPIPTPKRLEATPRESDAVYLPREGMAEIRKRSYSPWSISPLQRNSLTVFEASSVWKPSSHQISRPYYIPIYGVRNRIPIFYPPQVVYLNPGSPQDNPLNPSVHGSAYIPPKEERPFQGETYLPPKETTPAISKPNMTFLSRFGDDDEEMYIWGSGGQASMSLSGDQTQFQDQKPTRMPQGSGGTRPPLIHGQTVLSDKVPIGQDEEQARRAELLPSVRTTTAKPPPPGPSNCVWAIISCCSATEPKEVNQNCFEQRGCPGPFWGSSPCESDFAKAAISSAVKYYNTNSNLGK